MGCYQKFTKAFGAFIYYQHNHLIWILGLGLCFLLTLKYDFCCCYSSLYTKRNTSSTTLKSAKIIRQHKHDISKQTLKNPTSSFTTVLDIFHGVACRCKNAKMSCCSQIWWQGSTTRWCHCCHGYRRLAVVHYCNETVYRNFSANESLRVSHHWSSYRANPPTAVVAQWGNSSRSRFGWELLLRTYVSCGVW